MKKDKNNNVRHTDAHRVILSSFIDERGVYILMEEILDEKLLKTSISTIRSTIKNKFYEEIKYRTIFFDEVIGGISIDHNFINNCLGSSELNETLKNIVKDFVSFAGHDYEEFPNKDLLIEDHLVSPLKIELWKQFRQGINEGEFLKNMRQLKQFIDEEKILNVITKDLDTFKSVYREQVTKSIQKSNYMSEAYDIVIINTYLSEAIKLDVSKARKYFEYIFFKDFEEHQKEDSITEYIMQFEGLLDLSLFHMYYYDESTLKSAGNSHVAYVIDKRYHAYLKRIYLMAKSGLPVLIKGETGTSKEYMAAVVHEIHRLCNMDDNERIKKLNETVNINRMNDNKKEKKQKRSNFVAANCASLVETLKGSELFGHEKGAYTGADKKRDGWIKKAENGTLFLDEIGKLGYPLQGALLRLLQEKEYYPVGAEEPIIANIRFIAAIQPTDIDKLLPDLLYRLGYPRTLVMPTLNERLEWIEWRIITTSLNNVTENLGLGSLEIDQKCIDILREHKYKGNFRELENILSEVALEAYANNRNEIQPSDVEFVFNTLESSASSELSPVEDAANKFFENYIETIDLCEITEYAEQIKSYIIDRKLCQLFSEKGGGKPMPTLAKEQEDVDEQNKLSYDAFKKLVEPRVNKKIDSYKREFKDNRFVKPVYKLTFMDIEGRRQRKQKYSNDTKTEDLESTSDTDQQIDASENCSINNLQLQYIPDTNKIIP
ncbi:MAG: sigma 54-interacting transcriptional regulator [Nitrospirae bacterium]|nr:sigma 54-interacting transcriptional regulator [Nitrospirota bacterium]